MTRRIPRPLLVGGLSPAGLYLACLGLSYPQYQTNDDAAMNMMAAGFGLTDTPSPYLLFTHVGLGLVLRALYLASPGVPWYGLYLYALQFLAFVLLGFALLRLGPTLGGTLLWLTWLAVFGAITLVSPQFTHVSAFLAGAGVLACLSLVHTPPRSAAGRLVLASAGVAGLVLAGLVRIHAYWLALAVLLPLMLGEFARPARRGARTIGVALLVGAMLASSLLVWAERRYYAASPGWERFFEYNAVRAEFIDRARVSYSPDRLTDFRAVGWTDVDLEMLRSWFYVDANVYSLEHLRFLASRSPTGFGAALRRARLADPGSFLREPFLAWYGSVLALFLAVALGRSRAGRSAWWRPVAQVVWVVVVLAGLGLIERMPPFRVWLSALALAALGVLWEAMRRDDQDGASPARSGASLASTIAIVVGLGLVLQQGLHVAALSRRHQGAQAALARDLAELGPRPDRLYVVWGAAFPFEALVPVAAPPPDALRWLKLLGLGVGSHEPLVRERLRRFGISDLYQDLYRRDDVFLVAPRVTHHLDLLARYIRQHYGVAVTATVAFDGRTFAVFRLTRTDR